MITVVCERCGRLILSASDYSAEELVSRHRRTGTCPGDRQEVVFPDELLWAALARHAGRRPARHGTQPAPDGRVDGRRRQYCSRASTG
ncbi:MAG TPA: hypothetical protein VFA11_09600 [Acidimicrobiales bacterium]|nr:hypothetical protein [Acidimicrobiales bacterium]